MSRRISRPLAAAVSVPLAVLVAACGSSGGGSSPSSSSGAKMVGPALPSAPAKKAASVTETGSTLLFPLVSTWATAYQKSYPQVTITAGGTGSGTGIDDAITGTVDIGASDAYLSSSDTLKNPTLENIPVAISAQQINYNIPGLKGSLKLDGTVLASIYIGKITMWNDPAIKALNPGANLPSLKIVPLRRLDGSGDTFLFTSYLNKTSPSTWGASLNNTTISWPSVSGEVSETGNGGMVSGCAATKGCIAYIGISYLAKTQAAGLGQAMLKNASGAYLAPTANTISAAASVMTSKTPATGTLSLINAPGASAYPIINYEYAIVNTKQTDGTVAEDIRAFLHWDITSGQVGTYLDPVDFQALPGQVVSISNNLIAKIGA